MNTPPRSRTVTRPRSQRPKPHCVSARQWLADRNGRQALAPFTGGTSRLFSAYLHLLEAWAVGAPRLQCEAAMREIVAMLRPNEWRFAAEAIACSADWLDISKLWPRIKPAAAPLFFYDGDRVVATPMPGGGV